MEKNRQRELFSGIFILSGVILLLVLLFFLGLSDVFTTKIQLCTGFTESVQGLSRGSAVKYRGVQIGTVSDISILVQENVIQVNMEIDPEYFAAGRHNLNFPESEFRQFFLSEIKKKGLRARLEMLGITGMKFIDFDYFAKPDSPVPDQPHFSGKKNPLYIPSVTSQLKDITGTLTMAVDRISRIKFERISEQLESALSGLGELLNSQEIRSTITKINDTADHLETSSRAVSSVLSQSRIQGLVLQLEKNLEAFDKLQKSVFIITDEIKLPETTSAFREAMSDLSSSGKGLDDTLMKLNQTLESIRILTDYLAADPASLLRGKQKKTEEK